VGESYEKCCDRTETSLLSVDAVGEAGGDESVDSGELGSAERGDDIFFGCTAAILLLTPFKRGVAWRILCTLRSVALVVI